MKLRRFLDRAAVRDLGLEVFDIHLGPGCAVVDVHHALSALGGTPVVRLVLVVEMPDPCDQRAVAFCAQVRASRWGFERGQDTVGTVFDYKIIDRAVVGAALGTGFDIDVPHCFSSAGTVIRINRGGASAFQRMRPGRQRRGRGALGLAEPGTHARYWTWPPRD
jgi:hypothetical protein